MIKATVEFLQWLFLFLKVKVDHVFGKASCSRATDFLTKEKPSYTRATDFLVKEKPYCSLQETFS
ncbi:hypothetical protein ASG01_02180 [Chryseobacterium sp. Leaf180]|uniref:hypothetical protein n=1 Tax=Chryseobacterium sp. Leaf180 TaxID=1736289 RepID=UPI0007013469|nr:hypothetical protein [Chryseobacterium sp. Leaf180]KQR94705.1 hypothetical protein ASG01_02180 [Chryseobacterium sp. Leaf180]